ncbi:hypothetical protein [Ancylobacter sp. IITR112]|uniref:hypothetical protein n=1 Tax=Ancylobacter sp. IITR112 TaxID=3138073 RepID=UPI00352BA8DC
MKLSKIRSGVAKAEAGAWVRNLPIDGLDDLALKVRGAFNSDAIRLRTSLINELPKDERKPLSPENDQRISVEVAVRTILVDWNIEEESGKALPFSEDKARDLLNDPDIGRVLRNAVGFAAQIVASQGVEDLELDAKN